ncbi:MAG: TrbG/VirB9 family P-type conjugative transfer protein [Acidobacteriota bacterium]|nr:TrbG/VirB9 family P-type conjugative transfer protein [Defluviicoccus sp.]MDE3261940.1 TrbG/VirB9 family P-type conjugative transfer protein [Acidobacteriota bacterium]
MVPSFPILPLRLVAALVLFLACPVAAPAAAQDAHILRLDDTPEDTVWRLQARVRHTTVITLPARETILDYVVGDAEYWHLTGSANVAFLKPVSADVETNIALVCESGRIYSFLVAESEDLDPHLVVRFHDPAAGDGTDGVSAPGRRGAHQPAFVARSRIQSYQTMANQARAEVQATRATAEEQVTAARDAAAEEIDAFRARYPLRIEFPYTLDRKAREWPFLVEAMWHDGQFTYLRSRAQELPALYERKDGEPSVVPYQVTDSGLYIVHRIVGEGWLQLGKERVRWRFTPPDPLP